MIVCPLAKIMGIPVVQRLRKRSAIGSLSKNQHELHMPCATSHECSIFSNPYEKTSEFQI
eukprot:m.1294443 g.1294443  ORF g.1294443 m.1294443 type:complete len:60 (-) comp24788_c0_seq2:108-287(-)